MCRIAGIIGDNSSQSSERIRKMTLAMQHGGPDDSGHYVEEEGVTLGHRRLSIIDLSPSGHQPMKSEDADLVIVFNGEIYNYIELRNELIRGGYSFSSHSDTEVLLKGYEAWGLPFLQRLKGMFAFIIHDKKKAQIIAARDHAGIKPLYYGMKNGHLYFSSEIRGLKAAYPDWPQNDSWPIQFLSFGFIPEPHTTLEGVFHLPKGNYLVYDLNKKSIKISSFLELPFSATINTLTQAIQKTRSSLLDAVERHMVADVPVGLFLSGGIDSSILTVAAKKYSKENLRTLSVYFDDEVYSEKYFQDLIIKKTGVIHKSFLVSQNDFEEGLPDIFRAMDQPSIDGINTYFITKYAREYGLKVVLSGLGADELFGGYPSFDNNMYRRLKKMRLAARVVSGFTQTYPAKKLKYIKKGDGMEEYLFNRGLFVPSDVASILQIPEEKVWEAIGVGEIKEWKNLSAGNRASLFEQNIYMQNQLLRDSDIYSMWHSIELRVPFLDIDVIRTAHSISEDVKYNKAQKKHLLIEAFKDELPEEIWNRPKMGFTFPFQNWFKDSTYLKKIESKFPHLNPVRRAFDKGQINWSRYWSRIVAQEFQG